MAKSRYIVGIDLGTTNSVVAFLDARLEDEELRRVPVFEVPQLVAQGQVQARAKLPSFLYLPTSHELPPGSLRIPWAEERPFAVGEFARDRGALVPGRLVSSAKSWLSHASVDRTAEILPWGAAEDVERLSPVEASARYLNHIREAWNHEVGAKAEGARLEEQDVVLTVPASFDEVARELTVEAARDAGLERVTLIEEPQAAFYSWLFHNREDWQEHVSADQLILVCDVGGGTSDFSLIQVEAKGNDLGFRRIAVGDHLLLGGDNMDLALAASLEDALAGPGKKLDAGQWSSLRHSCRAAKEALLTGEGKETAPVAVPGRGSRLVGGTLRGELTRQQVMEAILDGFFPKTSLDEMPERSSRGGIQEFGLPYASDPAISKHLASFLRDPTGRANHAFRHPDLILFNGGVFKPGLLRERLTELLASWFPGAAEPAVLDANTDDLDLAVARGAAYYGLVRRGRGVRIAGGTARSFYVGLGEGAADEQGVRLQQAICVAPQGLEEGEEVEVADQEFELLIRQPVHFPFYSSSTSPLDELGEILPIDEEALRPMPPIQTVLRSGRKAKAESVRVRLHAILTEVGTLELWCVTAEGDRRWRLQFEVRKDPEIETPAGQTSGDVAEEDLVEQEIIEEGAALIKRTFEQSPSLLDKKLQPERLMKNLEAILRRNRGRWPPGALRGLWPAVLEVAERRTADPSFESRWLNLSGFLLRPGYGYPMDEWRLKEAWRLFNRGVVHKKDVQSCSEFWVLWRRVAGGLNKGQQAELFRRLSPTLLANAGAGKKGRRPKRITQEEMEMWRAAASIERIPAKEKRRLGEVLISYVGSPESQPFEMWALGRIGARVPFYGSIDTVVSRETAEEWIQRLLGRGKLEGKESTFALVQIARRSGDRTRDIDEDLREQVLRALRAARADDHLLELVREVSEFQEGEQAQAFGESLPPALRLVREDGDG